MLHVKNMQIVSYKKKNNNEYIITLSNNKTLTLFDDVILKYELLLKKEINNIEEVLKDNLVIESYYEALKFINKRLRTKLEVEEYLKGYDKEAVNYTIERLSKEKYLNDDLYIKCMVSDLVNLKVMGQKKIVEEVKKKGFLEEQILPYIDVIEHDVWLDKINKYVVKKINSNHNLSGYVLKNKVIMELVNKGFFKEDIMVIIENCDFYDHEEVYNKEYQKLYRKLSKKYSDELLDKQIKYHLYKKGFSIKE